MEEILDAESTMKNSLFNLRSSQRNINPKNREEVEKNQFERIMCATFGLTFGLNGSDPDQHPLLQKILAKNINIQCSAMEKLHNIKNFPCPSISEDVLDRIFKVRTNH
eukprot:PhF_6_TR42743/c1_g1_i1/m.64601